MAFLGAFAGGGSSAAGEAASGMSGSRWGVRTAAFFGLASGTISVKRIIVTFLAERAEAGSASAIVAHIFVALQRLWTTTKPAVLEVTGKGPFGVDYINPTDDPGKQHE